MHTLVLLDLKHFPTDKTCLKAVRDLYCHTRGWAKFFFEVKEVQYAQVTKVSPRSTNTLFKMFDLLCDSLETVVYI